MTEYQTGDTVSLSREGKVFITQYQSIAGFASLTRVMGDDPNADLEAMQALLDVAFRESVRRNLEALNACYAAAGGGGGDIDVDKLLAYLESPHEPEKSVKPKRKKRIVT